MRQQSFWFTAAAIGVLMLSRVSAGQEQAPWLGTWSLNLSKSQPARYKRVTSRIEPWRDGLKVSYDMVGIRGGVTHWEWLGKFDGKDYPMQGVDTVLTNAYRKIDGRSYEIVVKVDGAVVATSRVVVSPDGKTLQVSTEERVAGGQTVNTTAVYERKE